MSDDDAHERAQALATGAITFCDNPECDEEVRVRPSEDADEHYKVQTPDMISSIDSDVYCSARCVARAMAEEDSVKRVNVYDA